MEEQGNYHYTIQFSVNKKDYYIQPVTLCPLDTEDDRFMFDWARVQIESYLKLLIQNGSYTPNSINTITVTMISVIDSNGNLVYRTNDYFCFVPFE